MLRLFTLILVFLPTFALAERAEAPPMLEDAVAHAAEMEPLHSLIIAQEGEVLFEKAFRGPDLDQPVNVKSVAKTILSALVGIAIDRGILEGPDQAVAPLLREKLPAERDPRLEQITLGHLLSMQAGLERTSGENYGAWVTSDDWVAYALSRPFVAEPGGRMLYSSGNSHLLSAILTRETGRSTLALMRDWLGEPLDTTFPAWQRDPQGIYFGGNNMLVSPRGLLRFAELYRKGGLHEGERLLSEEWIEASWRPRTRSPHTGDAYGYGWFAIQAAGQNVYYGWDYGGQMIYVIPNLAASVVITSDPTSPSGHNGYAGRLHELLRGEIIPALAKLRTAGEPS